MVNISPWPPVIIWGSGALRDAIYAEINGGRRSLCRVGGHSDFTHNFIVTFIIINM